MFESLDGSHTWTGWLWSLWLLSSRLTASAEAFLALTMRRALSWLISAIALLFALKLTSKILAAADLISSGLKVVMRNCDLADKLLMSVAMLDRY